MGTGRSLLFKSGLAGRGGGCGTGLVRCHQLPGDFKVAVLPGGPGCLQRSPASSSDASCHPPGLPVLGMSSCCMVSCTALSSSLLKSISLSLFSVLFFLSLSLPFFRSPPLPTPPPGSFFFLLSSSLILCCIFPPSYIFHSVSLYLFWSCSFLFCFLFFFLSASFILHICFFLCLALTAESAAAQRQESPH